MPRIRRVCPPGAAQHVINRGNTGRVIFLKSGDYQAFLRLMVEAQKRVPMAVLGYCLMPTHFHFVLLPASVAALSAYMQWLTSTHVRQYHEHYGTCGTGHLYQGRYKNFAVQSERYLLNVWRYVEANALRAGLVRCAEHWRWSSLSADRSVDRPSLSESPIVRPSPWVDWVNEGLPHPELQAVRRSITRGAPYGDDAWTKTVAKANGLDSTLRRRGRPRK